MSENRVEGAMHKGKGAIKEAAGDLTDNEEMEAEGAAEKNVGDLQNKVGKAQDKIADAIRH